MDKATTDTRGIYARNSIKLANHHYNGYPFISRCTKSKIGRSINYCKKLINFIRKLKKISQMKKKRSSCSRDIIKQKQLLWIFKDNMVYDKIYRRGLKMFR